MLRSTRHEERRRNVRRDSDLLAIHHCVAVALIVLIVQSLLCVIPRVIRNVRNASVLDKVIAMLQDSAPRRATRGLPHAGNLHYYKLPWNLSLSFTGTQSSLLRGCLMYATITRRFPPLSGRGSHISTYKEKAMHVGNCLPRPIRVESERERALLGNLQCLSSAISATARNSSITASHI